LRRSRPLELGGRRPHVDYDPAGNARLGDPVRAIFQDLDAAVGKLVDCAGPDADVVVFSTSAMEPNGSLDHLMPEIVNSLNKWLRDRRASSITRLLSKVLGDLVSTAHEHCTILPYNENAAALRVRLKGMFHDAPLDVPLRDSVLQEIEALLLELTDAQTGEPVIASFARQSGLVARPTGSVPCQCFSACRGIWGAWPHQSQALANATRKSCGDRWSIDCRWPDSSSAHR
jgi:hypothetical protein